MEFLWFLTIKLTGGQKRSFWTSSERSERQLSAVMDSPRTTFYTRSGGG